MQVQQVQREDWHINFIKFALLEILRRKGYSKVEEHALKIFADVILETLKKLMSGTVTISNFCQRNESNFVDLVSTFLKNGVNLNGLVGFIKAKTELQEHMRLKGNQKYASSLSKKILNEISTQEQYICKRGLSDLNRANFGGQGGFQYQGQFKKIKVTSNYPLKMVKRDKEKDFTLELCPPPELSFSFTQNTDENFLNSHDVKNLKAEEKRIYEIENCKISAIADEHQQSTQDFKEKEYQGKNALDAGAKQLDRVNIFEISNNQMF